MIGNWRARSSRRRSKTHRGFSLVEVIGATALLAGTLTPTLEAMRAAMAQSREMTVRRLLANYAVRVLEEQIATSMQAWPSGTNTGDFAVDGQAAIRFVAVTSDASVDGGIPGRLMHVAVTVYEDADGDDALDTGELNVQFRTKIASLLTYDIL